MWAMWARDWRIALQTVERLEDRTRPLAAGGAARAEAFERGAGGFELGDACVEGGEALARQRADAGAVVGAVERQQLADFVEREARRLGAADEAQAPHILLVIAPDAAGARRHSEQPAALIVTHRLDPDSGRRAQAGDGERDLLRRRCFRRLRGGLVPGAIFHA